MKTKKELRPSDSARRGIQLALCITIDAINNGWEPKSKDTKDLESARRWLAKSFAARRCK